MGLFCAFYLTIILFLLPNLTLATQKGKGAEGNKRKQENAAASSSDGHPGTSSHGFPGTSTQVPSAGLHPTSADGSAINHTIQKQINEKRQKLTKLLSKVYGIEGTLMNEVRKHQSMVAEIRQLKGNAANLAQQQQQQTSHGAEMTGEQKLLFQEFSNAFYQKQIQTEEQSLKQKQPEGVHQAQKNTPHPEPQLQQPGAGVNGKATKGNTMEQERGKETEKEEIMKEKKKVTFQVNLQSQGTKNSLEKQKSTQQSAQAEGQQKHQQQQQQSDEALNIFEAVRKMGERQDLLLFLLSLQKQEMQRVFSALQYATKFHSSTQNEQEDRANNEQLNSNGKRRRMDSAAGQAGASKQMPFHLNVYVTNAKKKFDFFLVKIFSLKNGKQQLTNRRTWNGLAMINVDNNVVEEGDQLQMEVIGIENQHMIKSPSMSKDFPFTRSKNILEFKFVDGGSITYWEDQETFMNHLEGQKMSGNQHHQAKNHDFAAMSSPVVHDMKDNFRNFPIEHDGILAASDDMQMADYDDTTNFLIDLSSDPSDNSDHLNMYTEFGDLNEVDF